ncbi:F-box/kelch-repeat protein At3g06240-like [Papaver somniferum]|uniref:F-box/kelch-repeat protein At3g06240-like n=1 Tax=Papaver somniferum TaxID=3469 RepID=UPI000E70156D|nr:F-box/kelch-repeat protein At3g06240-like [Papaver somniferum]
MSSLLNLPEEVHDEIFLKLPGESILSSRCVCKFLYTLLSKPSFIKNHVNRTNQSKENPKLWFNHFPPLNPPIIYSVPIDYASISSSSPHDGAVLINYPSECENLYFLNYLGSCDGLICSRIFRAARERNCFMATNDIVIMNPLTREYKEFTMPIEGYTHAYGFGYDSNIDDYKLVIISGSEGCLKTHVYRVKSDSWSSIQGPVNYSFHGGIKAEGVFFNGALHWLGTRTTEEAWSQVIVSFDVSSETMVDMPLPENIVSPTDYWGEIYRNIGVLGDSICVAFIWDSVRIDVWVMQKYGVKESWTKRFTTPKLPCPSQGLLFWKPLWCFDNGEILIDDDSEQLHLYDPTAERVRSVAVCSIIMGNCRVSYVESISSLNSGKYMEKQIEDGILKNMSDSS